jgi:TetR/AcrR family transcriptional repressor of mexJK operon
MQMRADRRIEPKNSSTGPSSALRPRRAGKKNNPAGRPTEDELGRRKDRIREVATELFVRDGYSATSLVDIAKYAGVATRTVYQHFGDKEAIFRNVMYAPQTAAVFEPPVIHGDDTLFESMMRAAQYVYEVSFRPSTIDLMRLAIAESKRFPDLIQKLTHSTYERFRTNVRHIFEEAVSCGLVDDPDPAASADLFIDLILGTTPVLIYTGWESSPTDLQLEMKVDLFVKGRFGAKAAKAARDTRIRPQKTRARIGRV